MSIERGNNRTVPREGEPSNASAPFSVRQRTTTSSGPCRAKSYSPSHIEPCPLRKKPWQQDCGGREEKKGAVQYHARVGEMRRELCSLGTGTQRRCASIGALTHQSRKRQESVQIHSQHYSLSSNIDSSTMTDHNMQDTEMSDASSTPQRSPRRSHPPPPLDLSDLPPLITPSPPSNTLLITVSSCPT